MIAPMIVRNVPPSISAAMAAQIDAQLAAIRNHHRVTIPFAIESGSRAWGFPSPDSDYDCRFLFVRPVEHYLSPWQRRDVIETPLAGNLDINGWDLGKALRLLAKGNAVIIEWLMSPIIYCADRRFRDEFLALAHRIADHNLVARHYLHLGERYRVACLTEGEASAGKKIFYALRPAAALRWLRHHPGAVVPMHLPTLLAECEPPADVAAIVTTLIARKAVAGELTAEPMPAPVAAFIDQEFELARGIFEKRALTVCAEARSDAEAFFRATVQRLNNLCS